MSVDINGEEQALVGFRYDGSFPLDFLERDEQVAATGTGSGCVITSPRGHVRLRPGDFISRRQDGSLFTTSSQSPHHGPRAEDPPASDPPPSSGTGGGSRSSGSTPDPRDGASVLPTGVATDAPSGGPADSLDAAEGQGRR